MNLATIAMPQMMNRATSSQARFYMPSGIEVPTITAYQMRRLDEIARNETGPDALYMTERAGLATAVLTMQLLGSSRSKVMVLAGGGAVGQAGVCAARCLLDMRVDVRLCLSSPVFPGQFLSHQHRIFESAHGNHVSLWNLHEQTPDLIIDALLDSCSPDGIVSGNIPGMMRWANASPAPILSLDIPSGIDATSGKPRGEYIRPEWTLTCGLPKTGLRSENAGHIYLADIGLRSEGIERAGIRYINPFENELWIPLAYEESNPRIDW